jgi:hypothetical protein
MPIHLLHDHPWVHVLELGDKRADLALMLFQSTMQESDWRVEQIGALQ